ncbi:MAG: alpha/beta fold hydrolase [Alphaproteobacteria bacterium]|nr:MAG: alpha/beta fold hydrolase [Alphaproteobacteria bacterium]
MTIPTIELDGPRFGPPPGRATALVVLLHGLGADGNDLIALAPHFARAVPGAAFVAPHAPFPCDMAPFGRQWFSLQVREPAAILGGVRMAAPHLDAFLDAELARFALDDAHLALVGFSQGTMMALHVALRRRHPCAAVVGYSGMLVGPETLPAEIRSRPPVLLVHGEADEIVDVSALAAAEAALKASGVPVRAERRPGLGHGIDERGIELGMEMLARHLGPGAGPQTPA